MSRLTFILENAGQFAKPFLYRPIGSYPQGQQENFHPQLETVTSRLNPDLPTMYSYLGTPIFANVVLSDPESGLSLAIDQILCEVKTKKNIVVTEVEGLDGTVKEFIANGDFVVTMVGGIFSIDANAFPLDDVNTLARLLEVNKALDVSSDFLSIFKIYHLVIMDYRMPQKPGRQNSQYFEIKALSDLPVQLKLDQEAS